MSRRTNVDVEYSKQSEAMSSFIVQLSGISEENDTDA